MVKTIIFSAVFLLFFACQKATERACFKSNGAMSTLEIPIDSVSRFSLYKNLNYHIYQDTTRRIILKGGANVISMVEVKNQAYELSIRNKNKCHFLRDFEKHITVEIHYPFYKRFYSETEDSLVFKDTIHSEQLYVEQALGAGYVELTAAVGTLILVASHGVGHFHVSGEADFADLRVQSGAWGSAENLRAQYFLIDQNSTGDLVVNLDSAQANIAIKGTGNVLYLGNPDTVSVNQTGAGNLIKK